MVGLRQLDAAKGSLGDLRVPFEVVQYVDEGKNPQSYTKDCMEKAMQKNEEVKGKIDAFKVSIPCSCVFFLCFFPYLIIALFCRNSGPIYWWNYRNPSRTKWESIEHYVPARKVFLKNNLQKTGTSICFFFLSSEFIFKAFKVIPLV